MKDNANVQGMIKWRWTFDKEIARRGVFKDYPEDVVEHAFAICDAYGISPLLGHIRIHTSKYQDPPGSGNWRAVHTPYVMRDGYLDIAQRTEIPFSVVPGTAQKLTNPYTGKPDILLRAVLKRVGYPDFEHEAWFSEYNTGKSVWAHNPATMHYKVVMYQLLKYGFNIGATAGGEDDPVAEAEMELAERSKRIAASAPMSDENIEREKANLFGEPEPEPPATEKPPITAESIREQVQAEIADLKKRYNGKAGNLASDKQLDYLRSLICKAEPDDQKRHSVLAYLVGKTSTLTQAEASALISWLKGEDGGLKADGAAEAALCLTARLKEAGQWDLFGEEETNGTA